MTTNSNYDSPYVDSAIWLPEDDAQRMIRMTDLFNQFSNAINLREIGVYENSESITGEQWGPPNLTNQERLVPFRKVLGGNITGSGTTTVPHGITNLLFCTRIYGTAVNSGTTPTTFIPLPQSAPDDVNIVVNQTNILVKAATNTYNGYPFLVILEYLRS